jgi:hypothetical protein
MGIALLCHVHAVVTVDGVTVLTFDQDFPHSPMVTFTISVPIFGPITLTVPCPTPPIEISIGGVTITITVTEV